MAAAARRIYRRGSVGGDFLQLQGGGAAQIVDAGIIREGNETIGFYHLTVDTLAIGYTIPAIRAC